MSGDIVEVSEGELIHLQGKVISVDGNKITMLPKHEDLKVNRTQVLIIYTCFIRIFNIIIIMYVNIFGKNHQERP